MSPVLGIAGARGAGASPGNDLQTSRSWSSRFGNRGLNYCHGWMSQIRDPERWIPLYGDGCHCRAMNRSLGALASVLVLSGALCLATTGTAQAISGNFSCGLTTYNPATGAVGPAFCGGGPVNATSG